MRLIAPFGFYGWGNIGDEASLQGFARLLASSTADMQVWAGSRNPQHCRRAEPNFQYFDAAARRSLRRRWAWRTADAMVVAGGTPVSDALGHWPLSEVLPLVERASEAMLPVAFVGVGTEPLERDESQRLVADRLAPHVGMWTVRSEQDRTRLLSYGCAERSVVRAADMAWALDPVRRDFGERRLRALGVDPEKLLIGVNVNIEAFVRAEQPRLLIELAWFLDGLVASHDATILFLCNEVREGPTFDRAASHEVMDAMRSATRCTLVPNDYLLPQEMLSLIACCSFTVSTRYHFCLFSALQGVPFVAVQRSAKLTDLATDMAWPHTVSLQDATARGLTSCMERLMADRTAAQRELAQATHRMRALAQHNAVALTALTAPRSAAALHG